MQPKTPAAAQFASEPTGRLSSVVLQIPVMLCAAVVAAVLVAKLEAIGYAPGAVQPDTESVYQTMIVSP